MNYKFREVMKLFESLVMETQRINVNLTLMPGITQQISLWKVQTSACILSQAITRKSRLQLCHSFQKWRGRQPQK